MLNLITITGEYLLNDSIVIGGKEFKKNLILETNVNEDTFKNLQAGQENGWFLIKSHNYEEFLISRGRPLEVSPIKEFKIEAPQNVVEIPQNVLETPQNLEDKVPETPQNLEEEPQLSTEEAETSNKSTLAENEIPVEGKRKNRKK